MKVLYSVLLPKLCEISGRALRMHWIIFNGYDFLLIGVLLSMAMCVYLVLVLVALLRIEDELANAFFCLFCFPFAENFNGI